jgi:hypothetical protein
VTSCTSAGQKSRAKKRPFQSLGGATAQNKAILPTDNHLVLSNHILLIFFMTCYVLTRTKYAVLRSFKNVVAIER